MRFDLQYIWNSFHELGSERQIGMGLGPIPASRIRSHVTDVLGIEAGSEAAETVFEIIRRMDSEYLSVSNATTSDKTATAVSVDDPVGVIRLFDVIESRKRQQQKNTGDGDDGKERT